MSGEIKINRIKSKNKTHMNLLSEIVAPEVLHERVPRLAEVQEARVEYKNLMNTIQTIGNLTRATGFDKSKNFQYVANIDSVIWNAILEVFAKHDPETGKPMDDGLLYVTDHTGRVKLNRDFFYALLSILEDAGYKCDMRGKIKLT